MTARYLCTTSDSSVHYDVRGSRCMVAPPEEVQAEIRRLLVPPVVAVALFYRDGGCERYERLPPAWHEPTLAFDRLSLGSLFSYIGSDRLWVKVGPDLIAEWDSSPEQSGYASQRICCFTDPNYQVDLDTQVILRDPRRIATSRQLPGV